MQMEISAAELRIGDKIIWPSGHETTVTSTWAENGEVHVYEAEAQGGPPVRYAPGDRVGIRRGEEGQPRE